MDRVWIIFEVTKRGERFVYGGYRTYESAKEKCDELNVEYEDDLTYFEVNPLRIL